MNQDFSLKKWQDLPAGGAILEGGNSVFYETGTWRTWKPVYHAENCIQCLNCWVFCPEDAFSLQNQAEKKVIQGIDYFHCKGCGICAKECPINKNGKKKAIAMIKEEM